MYALFIVGDSCHCYVQISGNFFLQTTFFLS